MGEFSDSDSDDLEAMFPDSPEPDFTPVEVKPKENTAISLNQPASLQGPTISRQLKPLYVSLLKKEVFIFSATISGTTTNQIFNSFSQKLIIHRQSPL